MARPETASLTVDVIIELADQPRRPIVLIERKYPPFGWAIPGGFVDVGEMVETAAVREAKEETCLDVRLTAFLGVYSEPARDPRGHTTSLIYIGEATGMPSAADDAKNFGIFSPDALPEEMAFDHGQIMQDYLHFRNEGHKPGIYGL